jgi:cytochrome P450 family 110
MDDELMSVIGAKSKVVPLNPWQQWRYFSEPMTMSEWIRKRYGNFVPVHFQGNEYVAIVTAEGARQVFSADPNGYEVFWKESFAGLMGDESVWVQIGKKHRIERQLFAPAVHANHYRAYGKMIRDITHTHIDPWKSGQTIRSLDTTLAISLDIIMRLVFGVEDEQVMQEGHKVLNASTSYIHPSIVFFPSLQRSWFPIWRRYTKARGVMYDWVDKLLIERRVQGNARGDVLDMLMNSRDENGDLVDNDYIHTELNSILSAGHETTGTALAWTLYELGRHPDILEKLRVELESTGHEPDPERLLTLPYLNAVCNEAIRLHPILAECARVPMQPMEILGRTIPVGRALVVSIAGIHHDSTVYPEPQRFIPERFIEKKYNVHEFLPFGGGHRRCLGAGLAQYSMRIAIAQIVSYWDFETAGVDRDVRCNIAMGPKHGVRLRIKGRRNPSWVG